MLFGHFPKFHGATWTIGSIFDWKKFDQSFYSQCIVHIKYNVSKSHVQDITLNWAHRCVFFGFNVDQYNALYFNWLLIF